jgi:hypothetical protein
MKILIAGNMGQIGPALVAQLRFSNHLLNFCELENLHASKLQDAEVVIVLTNQIDIALSAKKAGVKHLIIPINNNKPLYQEIEALTDASFQVTLLHYGTLCCMSDSLRRAALLHDYVAAAMIYGEININAGDARWHSLIHVNDLARAIIWALDRKPEITGNFLSIQLGSDNWTFQLKDLAEAVTRIVPGSIVKFNAVVTQSMPSAKPDFSLFKRLAPKHQPRYILDHTILQLYAAYLETGLCDKPTIVLETQIRLLQLN